MWVPKFQIGVGGFEFYDDILFNIGLVATAEELSKVISIRLLYMKMGDNPGGRAFSVMGPIAFWSMLHGYKAYVGLGEAAMWVMIAGAFGAGLVMFWVWKETENILAAILVHGFHNSIVILSPVLREAQAPSISADVVFYAVTAVVVIGGILAMRSRRNRRKLASILT